MKKNILKHLISLFITTLSLVMWQSASAFTVDKIIAFGDSTSDNGNIYSITSKMHKVISKIPLIPKKPPYFEGRFSNGPVWLETMSTILEVPLIDYAYGGSWAEPLQDSHQLIPFSLGMQVNFYLVKGVWDRHKSKHLYTIWSGSNDYLEGRDDAEYATTKAVETIRQQITSLIFYGARQFMVLGVPELNAAPKIIEEGPVVQAEIKVLSDMHNKKLAAMIKEEQAKNPEVKIIYVDVAESLRDVIAHPDNYGLKVTDKGCYQGDYYLGNKYVESQALEVAKAQNLDILANTSLRTAYINALLAEHGVEPCANPEDYLYWDKVHPSAAAHQLLSMLAINILEEEGIYSARRAKTE